MAPRNVVLEYSMAVQNQSIYFLSIFVTKKFLCSQVLFFHSVSNFLPFSIYSSVMCIYTESFILIQDLFSKQHSCEKVTCKTTFSILKPQIPTPVASPQMVLRVTDMSKLCLNEFVHACKWSKYTKW